MAANEKGDTPPDLLNDGVALNELLEGEPLLGTAGGEDVLIVRAEGELYAVAPKCTHYGGPLNDGLVVGHTVRCPWHHACFDLRTGEALRAPALNPLANWQVEERGGRAYVANKNKPGILEPTAESRKALAEQHPNRVLIIGGGAAGGAAAEMLRRTGFRGVTEIIDPEESAPYDRPNLSKDYLAGNAPESWIPLRSEEFYAEHNIVRFRTQATSIDLAQKRVALADGSTRNYDSLLITTGAEPRTLDVPGIELKHVHLLRSLADSRTIIRAAESARNAVVIGASFIGLEVAASLRERGLNVSVAAPDETPLERVMGKEIGEMIRGLHEHHGVKFHLGRTAARITEEHVELEDGTRLSAELVVLGVGVKPRLALAEEAGLEVDKGVVVNEYLETSAPGVFAAGDIARYPDPRTGERVRVEHWVVAQRLGQAAARNMLGAKEPFLSTPFFWSKHYDISVRYSGHAEKWDVIDIDGDLKAPDFSAAFRLNGKTLAVASVKRDLENLRAAVALERGDEDELSKIVPR